MDVICNWPNWNVYLIPVLLFLSFENGLYPVFSSHVADGLVNQIENSSSEVEGLRSEIVLGTFVKCTPGSFRCPVKFCSYSIIEESGLVPVNFIYS